MFTDTIFALSSGRLPAGVAIVRLSGNKCRFACETVCGSLPSPREAKLTGIRSQDGSLLDTGLVLWFPAPRSFTGEDCLELHLHGGTAVVKAVLDELSHIPGLRQAEAGEFTHRAFIHGKLDLVQAEALSDLISAETEAQRRFAVANAEGQQSRLYASWRDQLVLARAAIEAELDFSDERDVPEGISQSQWGILRSLAGAMDAHCRGYKHAEIIRDGFHVVLAGAPNVGKSSLLNALVRKDVAIVSAEAGTTRDLIEVDLDLGGYKVKVTDTAGLRETEEGVERIGIERARGRMAGADLVLALIDMTAPLEIEIPEGPDILRVGTKADLVSARNAASFEIAVSAVSGAGVSELLEIMENRVTTSASKAADTIPSQLRHVSLVTDAQRHVEKAAQTNLPLEMRAESLRLASNALGRITGEIDVEDILSSIFSRFCIGK